MMSESYEHVAQTLYQIFQKQDKITGQKNIILREIGVTLENLGCKVIILYE